MPVTVRGVIIPANPEGDIAIRKIGEMAIGSLIAQWASRAADVSYLIAYPHLHKEFIYTMP